MYPFLNPMGLYCLSVVLAFLLRNKFKRFAFGLIVVTTSFLFVFSTKFVGQFLFERLEQTHPPIEISATPYADYIVLLGGALGVPESPRLILEFGFLGDRILHASRLYKAGVAPKIIVSGGRADPDRNVLSEAQYMSQLLVELGVPQSDIVLEERSRTTRENAQYTAKLVSKPDSTHIVLVTSALHMPRAHSMFSDAPFASVTPASADIYIPERKESLWRRLIPSSTGIALSTNAIDEMLGALLYQWRR